MNRFIQVALTGMALSALSGGACWSEERELIRRTVLHDGKERTYFVSLANRLEPEQPCWPLVFVHGGRGNVRANDFARSLRQLVREAELPMLLILPEFITEDKQVSRFPALGEGDFLKAVLRDAHSNFSLRSKILLTGYSMGGQFAHRFAFENPELVLACAPCAAGTWTTPDGQLLIEGYGAVVDPETFLSNPANAEAVPARLHNLFDERTARIAGRSPAAGANTVAYLVMCGTLDTRHEITITFVESLQKAGFSVESEWPVTPHGSEGGKYTAEFERFPRGIVRFFHQQIETAE